MPRNDIQPHDILLWKSKLRFEEIFENKEFARVAKNLIALHQRWDAGWCWFTYQEYSEACTHDASKEEILLKKMVTAGYLNFLEGNRNVKKIPARYQISNTFLGVIIDSL